jgi:transcriptional regulator with XRE-family HTH domain
MDIFLRKVKEARKLLKLTQNQLAEAIGFDQKDVSNIENGNRQHIPIQYISFLLEKGVDVNSLYNPSEAHVRFITNPISLNTNTPIIPTSKPNPISKKKELQVGLAAEPPPEDYGTHTKNEQIDFLSKLLKEREHVIISQERELKSQEKIIELLEEKLDFTQRHTVGKAGSATTQKTTSI